MKNEYDKINLKKNTDASLIAMRSILKKELQFYKNYFKEEYAINHPDSMRYKDAQIKIDQINEFGKKIRDELKSRQIEY